MANATKLLLPYGAPIFAAHDHACAFSVCFERKRLLVADRRQVIELPFEVIKGVNVQRTYGSHTKTSGGLSLTGAIVGGLIAGPAAAVIGGVTGKRTAQGQDYLRSLTLDIEFWSGGAGGVNSFVLHRSDSHYFAEKLDAMAEKVAGAAVATLNAAMRQAVEFAPAAANPAMASPAKLPSPTFTDRADTILIAYGWRTKREADGVILGIREQTRAIFICEADSALTGFSRALGRMELFPQATYRAVIGDTTSLDIRRAGQMRGVKVFELRELEKTAPKVRADAFAF